MRILYLIISYIALAVSCLLIILNIGLIAYSVNNICDFGFHISYIKIPATVFLFNILLSIFLMFFIFVPFKIISEKD